MASHADRIAFVKFVRFVDQILLFQQSLFAGEVAILQRRIWPRAQVDWLGVRKSSKEPAGSRRSKEKSLDTTQQAVPLITRRTGFC
jgi:hypothetical protein